MIKVNAHTLNHLSGDANINVIATLEKPFLRLSAIREHVLLLAE